jgi:NAD(P)-dependent dehydrogenase (short-subunit alcohol dehydrogenase family)
MELHGKVAVVTGASSGIGEATTRRLAAEGVSVVAVARRTERLEALASELDGVHAYTADLTIDPHVEALAGWVAAQFGACHVLVNNAGGSIGYSSFRRWEDRKEIFESVDLNFFGVVRAMGAFAELLADSAPARVVNVASVAGKLGVDNPGYSAAKFAAVGFTEAVGADWSARGVTVSQVNPGFVRTEGFPQEELMASALTRPLVGDPAMVAEAITDVARSGQHERTVPRWYRPLVAIRHVVAPLFWAVARRLPL